jgi:hypothetical protein
MEKREILELIRTTALNNGGKPLGRARFFKETGIKESDWSGKHWVTWNDAVRDAGFEPNDKQKAFESSYLLLKYAELVRELGKIPTMPELRLKARTDLDFPSHNTFNRFGSKQQLLQAILSHCQGNNELSDVVSIIGSEPDQLRSATDPVLPGKSRETGYVYLLKFGNEHKIGTSNNVERRFSQIRTQMPHEGKIIHTIETGDPEGIEAYWHGYFADKRLRGEWFQLTPDDVRYFKKRRLM